jgi:hypothetical protein
MTAMNQNGSTASFPLSAMFSILHLVSYTHIKGSNRSNGLYGQHVKYIGPIFVITNTYTFGSFKRNHLMLYTVRIIYMLLSISLLIVCYRFDYIYNRPISKAQNHHQHFLGQFSLGWFVTRYHLRSCKRKSINYSTFSISRGKMKLCSFTAVNSIKELLSYLLFIPAWISSYDANKVI